MVKKINKTADTAADKGRAASAQASHLAAWYEAWLAPGVALEQFAYNLTDLPAQARALVQEAVAEASGACWGAGSRRRQAPRSWPKHLGSPPAGTAPTKRLQAMASNLNALAAVTMLSACELEVARLVAEGSSSKEIAARLDLSVRTVEKHRANIMDKIGVREVASLVRWCVQTGIVKM